MTLQLNPKTIARFTGTLALASVVGATTAGACAVCFGDPNDPQSHALNQAILTLLGVLGVVCSGIGVFTLRMIARTRAVEAGESVPQPSAQTGEA